ncbi:MAG TPA: ParB/Srx family N-terminal domain-containing protein [Treponemataceae bacterium]|nr:ParB/Srx family N-terminal domain-containing protein [Treponemataceae bacterium]
MAKSLTMTRDSDKIDNCNSGDRKIGFDVFIKDINYEEPFLSFFKINEEVLEAITEDMKKNGYDSSKPVVLWKKPNGDKVLIDGHTRVNAAKEAGLMKVVAYEKIFINVEEAIEYAIHSQKARRNITNAELFKSIELIDSLKTPGNQSASAEADYIPERSASRTARIANTSKSTVERARVVKNNPEEAQLVREGKKSIYKACQDIKAKKTEQIPQEPPLAPLDLYEPLKKFHITLKNAIQDHRQTELDIAPEDKERFILKGKIESLEWANEEAIRIFPKIPANKSVFGTDISTPPSK